MLCKIPPWCLLLEKSYSISFREQRHLKAGEFIQVNRKHRAATTFLLNVFLQLKITIWTLDCEMPAYKHYLLFISAKSAKEKDKRDKSTAACRCFEVCSPYRTVINWYLVNTLCNRSIGHISHKDFPMPRQLNNNIQFSTSLLSGCSHTRKVKFNKILVLSFYE